MTERPVEILLVEDNIELAETIEQNLLMSIGANVTHVASANEALREELTAQHHVVISNISLPDTDGLAFISELRRSNKCPVILIAENPTVQEAIEAIRLGVRELLVQPLNLEHLSEKVQQFAEFRGKQLHRRKRLQRLRKIASSIIRERKDLNRRMDLICRDFVHAYRRLAQKVSDTGLLSQHSDQ